MPYCLAIRMELKRTELSCLAKVITHEGAVPLNGGTLRLGPTGPQHPSLPVDSTNTGEVLKMATQAQLAAVQQLYVGYLGRAADSAGQKFWADAIANGTATIASVATGFTLSAEYKAAYGGLSTDALVEKVYNNVLGRTPDAEGKAFWVAALANGKVTADTLVATIVTNLGALDQQTINNKVFVAQTYTDTVGTSYNASAGAEVLVGVDSTPASVTAALAAISTGTLTGQVPGLSLINASVVAQDAVTTYGETAATTNPDFDADEDGVVTSDEADDALEAATDARFDAANGGVSALTTRQLQADAGDKADTLATTKAAVEAATGGAAAVKAFEAAFAADASATATLTAAAPAIASAEAGLDKAVVATGATVTLATLNAAAGLTGPAAFANAADITKFLGDTANAGTPALAKLVTELNKVPTFGAGVVDAGVKTLAANTAAEDLVDATSDLNAIDLNGATAGTNTYITDKTAATTAADLVKDAQEADAAIVTAKTVVDQYTVLNKAVVDANAAIVKFAGDNSTKVSIQDIAGTPAADADKALSDVFYFKAPVVTGDDATIANFSAGDSIVLGAGYTQGASFAAGNNNVLEYFFVKTDTGTQVVIETQNFGSSQVTASATAGVAATGADNLAVITLTGVTAEHLSVANGVISYV